MIACGDTWETPKSAWERWINRRDSDIAADIARQTEQFLVETREFQSISPSVFLSIQRARHALAPLLQEISEHTVAAIAEELLAELQRSESPSVASASGEEEDVELRRWQ